MCLVQGWYSFCNQALLHFATACKTLGSAISSSSFEWADRRTFIGGFLCLYISYKKWMMIYNDIYSSEINVIRDNTDKCSYCTKIESRTRVWTFRALRRKSFFFSFRWHSYTDWLKELICLRQVLPPTHWFGQREERTDRCGETDCEVSWSGWSLG